MHVQVNCSNCGQRVRIPEEALNQNVQCPTCGSIFLAEMIPSLSTPPAPPAPLPSPPPAVPPPLPAAHAPWSAAPRPQPQEEHIPEVLPARRRPDIAPGPPVGRGFPPGEYDPYAEYGGPPPRKPFPIGLAIAGIVLFVFMVGFVVVAGLGLIGGSAEWKEYRSPGGQFRVLMPGHPKSVPAAAGNMVLVAVETDRGRKAFLVGYEDFPGDRLADDALEARFGRARENMLRAYPGARKLSERPVMMGGHPGREYTIEVPSRKVNVVVLIYLVDRGAGLRIYVLTAVGSRFTSDTTEVRRFFDSFQLTQEVQFDGIEPRPEGQNKK